MTPQFRIVDNPRETSFQQAWERHVSAGELSLDLDYLRLVSEATPEASHHYVACIDAAGAICGLAYVSLTGRRIAGLIPLRVLVLGGTVAGGQAFWFDEAVLRFADFMAALRSFLARAVPHDLIVLKEFSSGRDATVLQDNCDAGFVNVLCFDRSRVDLRSTASLDAWLDTLPAKKRYYLKQVLRHQRESGLAFDVMERFDHLVDELYPLYLAVNARATEARTQALPKSLFHAMARQLGSSRLLVARQDGRCVGFGLLLERHDQVKCMVIGLDYAVSRQLNLWYAIVLRSIEHAVTRGCSMVDLGSTNHDMKRKFGAASDDIWISVRHRTPWLNRLLAPYIRHSLKQMYAPKSRDREVRGKLSFSVEPSP
ncbi:GNAT family N-acetyltransferase [Piscinibacter terrae]|uniref:GNAT family N-acetyltransferase n=1 Tax=Piscinibacter terrae TaxID=2496871 RepID=A0A3N7JRS8_9BURK|nr:GNAT family N-acetyltransferase [Albitalea terrae]RQP21735.1 GNAT family N-acetyltransferase [Albitalea terrae]